jgi:uncharacterized protein YggU (UPF0235/DUF167 family)
VKISVKVKPNTKEEKIEKTGEGSFLVWVKAKPQDGKANYAVREALANYFGIPKARVIIITGETSRNKICEIFL